MRIPNSLVFGAQVIIVGIYPTTLLLSSFILFLLVWRGTFLPLELGLNSQTSEKLLQIVFFFFFLWFWIYGFGLLQLVLLI